jgi:hypothetical protein
MITDLTIGYRCLVDAAGELNPIDSVHAIRITDENSPIETYIFDSMQVAQWRHHQLPPVNGRAALSNQLMHLRFS